MICETKLPGANRAECRTGKVLMKCFAGGTFDEICDALDIKAGNTFVKKLPVERSVPPTGKPAKKPFATAQEAIAVYGRKLGKPSGQWTSVGLSGEPDGMVVRWDLPAGKQIRQLRRDGDGWHLEGMRSPKPLDRLTELKDARRVAAGEGEPVVEMLRSHGMVATTSAGGSQAASQTDWSPLAGKEALLLPDNDAPGRKYAADVAGLLAKLKSCKVEIVELPGLPDKGDVVDWVNAHDAVEPDALR